jgi:hypothetical protein
MVMVTISVPAGTSGSGSAIAAGATETAEAEIIGLPSPAGERDSATSCATLGATGAAFGAGALPRSAAVSPSARMVAIGVLTATSSVPSGIRILPRVPSSVASTSIVALSVSISAMTSPD